MCICICVLGRREELEPVEVRQGELRIAKLLLYVNVYTTISIISTFSTTLQAI